MQSTTSSIRRNGGFSLIQVSLLVAVASILMVSILPGGQLGSESEKRAVTMERMQKIHDAMRTFMITNQRLPCPVRATWGFFTFLFGKDQNNPGSCTVNALYNPPFSDSSTAAGLVPVRTLGLPDDYAIDGYGRRFMYMVDKEATDMGTCHQMMVAKQPGKIRILSSAGSSTTADRTMWALMSYGADGHGAYSLQGNATRLNTGTTYPDTMYNAFASDASLTTSYHSSLVKHGPTGSGIDRFDDIVWYDERDKNTCCLGQCMGGDSKTGGFRIDGPAGTGAGWALAKGDVNGDGIDDLLIGAPSPYGGAPGSLYVVFGTTSGFANPLPLSSLDGSNGFRLDGNYGWFTGHSVATGDVNGDGITDIVVSGQGNYIYVMFGKTSAWAATGDLETIANGTTGFKLDNTNRWDVAVGDFNGDGYADIAGQNPMANTQHGYFYLVFGKASGWSASYDLSTTGPGTILDGTQGFRLEGNTSMWYDYTDKSLAMGDINGDGKKDIVIGNWEQSSFAGTVYVLFGRTGAWSATQVMSTGVGNLFDGTKGFTMTHAYSLAGYLGWTVNAGDTNGDGYEDLILGSNSGNLWTYVIYGKSGAWSSSTYTLDGGGGSDLIDGTRGFRIDREGFASDMFGIHVNFGNVNGDTYADMLIAAVDADGTSNVGAMYVVYGKASWPAFQNADSTILNGTNGFVLNGVASGDHMSGGLTLDINGDGINDIVTNAWQANSNAGRIYVLFGKEDGFDASFDMGDL